MGEENPYYGVLTDNKFRNENLDDQLKAEFFETGRIHIERVLAMARRYFGVMPCHESALDFGCGVGRLVVPLAGMFDRVTGVDISSGMLAVADKNCSERGIKNVCFVRSDDELTQVTDKFDFVHSYLVLQHIQTQGGEKLISHLMEQLKTEGILAIHLPFMRKDSMTRKSLHYLRRNFSPLSILVNIIRRRPWNEPFIQMNIYDMNRLMELFAEKGIKDIFLEVVDAGGFVLLFLQRSPRVQCAFKVNICGRRNSGDEATAKSDPPERISFRGR
jgi:ubiquinone/menaquinone biosynthesis C-methylase UbiE